MEAVAVLLIVVILIALVWGGITLKKYIQEKYGYNIFSPTNLILGCVVVILSVAAFLVYDDAKAFTLNVAVLIAVAFIIYAAIFFMNLQTLDLGLAILTTLYQILLSSVIVLIILFILFRFFGNSRKK